MPEKYRVEITSIAEKDVEELWEYIAKENIEVANSFVLHLQEQIERLENFPLRCLLLPENELLGTEYRHYLHGKYRIIFGITGSRVIILRVLHTARMLDTEML